MNESMIRIKNLSVSYGQHLVLQDINCEIKQGEFIGILGKSGTGKTTLLNAIAKFIKYEGEISTSGNIGFCFQQNSLFHWMTVAENILYGIHTKGKAERKEITYDLLKKIGLEHAANKYPFELSGGQQQRVSLARALAYKPSIILLDEPFSSLDVLTRDLMIEWLLNFIKDYKVTVIMVTHYIDEALIFADRIFVLKNANLEDEISIDYEKPRTQQVRLLHSFQERRQILMDSLKK